jgi:hypothetical protein
VSQGLSILGRGIAVSAPTAPKLLEDHGFGPPGGSRTWEEYTAAVGGCRGPVVSPVSEGSSVAPLAPAFPRGEDSFDDAGAPSDPV